ncbi:DUF2115 family protein [Methanobacterium sp.]|uniref:DUF2115 family protein n=1 Tax=Methanobacterium sp. TaxID=2164 RepID=UPI003C776B82
MKTSELLLKLKECMKKYKPKMRDSGDSLNQIMSRYNLENFNEIVNSSLDKLDEEVDEEKLKDLQERIDHYFILYAHNDEEFKEFIKAISIYLTFIAKKPLHPPGIVFSNGIEVYKKDGIYYCAGKPIFIKDKLSLCKYCVCKGI